LTLDSGVKVLRGWQTFLPPASISGSCAPVVSPCDSFGKVIALYKPKMEAYMTLRKLLLVRCALFLATLVLPQVCLAGNAVLGEIRFEGRSNVERTSGVWVDGEYVGYLKELKGDKTVMLLPGKHTIMVRQDGYKDFTADVTVQPGGENLVNVAMEKAVAQPLPRVTSTVQISAYPPRAAVFMDGLFVGHVGEFNGWGRALLVPPGTHRIRIALPGYESFEADINPRPNQKVEIKTDLLKSREPIDDALLAPGEGNAPPAEGSGGSTPNAMASPAEK
jgi:PEGA domain-containing protein